MKFAQAAIFTLLYALIPWVAIFGPRFRDLEAYNDYFDILRGQEIEVHDGLLKNISSEVMWDLLCKFSLNTLDKETYVFIIIVISSLMIFNFLNQKTNSIYAFLIMMNPLMIDVTHSQIRGGIGLGLFLSMLLIKKKYWELTRIIPAFIHAGFFPISLLSIIVCRIKSKIIFFTIYIVLLIGIYYIFNNIYFFLEILGDSRRLGIIGNEWNTPKMVLVWGGCLCLLLVYSLKDNLNEYLMLSIMVLTLFIVGNFSGIGLYRYITFIFPVVAVAVYLYKGKFRIIGFMFIFFESLLHFNSWSGLNL